MSTSWTDAGRDSAGRRRLVSSTDVVATQLPDGSWDLRAIVLTAVDAGPAMKAELDALLEPAPEAAPRASKRTIHEVYDLRDRWLRKGTKENPRQLTDHSICAGDNGDVHTIMAVWRTDGHDELRPVDGASYEDVLEAAIEEAIEAGARL
jgi:hypothetical protein